MKDTSDKTGKSKAKTANHTDTMSSLRSKLKAADPEIHHYVEALEAENLKLQKRVGKMQADNTSLKNRITVLQENTNERCVHDTPPYECLQKAKEQIDAQIKELEKSLKKKAR
jgi:predicted RNase H-like nuclease (RuvC/YqgF family)